MDYLDLPKPHGWLIWRGKQKAIASDKPLSLRQSSGQASDSLLVISDGEAYGQATLSQPSAVNVTEFERMEDEHCVRREERKLLWPDSEVLYIHRLKDWQPFEAAKMVKLDNGQAEVIDLPTLTREQAELIKQAERLPKTLVLLDEAVTLCDGKAVFCNGVDGSKIEQILKVTLDGAKSAEDLPLYQLALVRIPRLSFKEKKSSEEVKAMPLNVYDNQVHLPVVTGGWVREQDLPTGNGGITVKKATSWIYMPVDGDKAMPYKKVKRGDEWCVIQSDTEEIEKCYDGEGAEDKADDLLTSLRINVEADEGKSLKELIAEARKCYYDGMAMPVMSYGPASFAEWDELEEAEEIASDIQELNYRFSASSSIIFTNPEITDKGTALSQLAGEYSSRVQEVGKKEIETDTKTEELTDDSKVGKRVRTSMMAKVKQAMDWLKEFMDWAEPQEEAETMVAFSKANHFGVKQINGKAYFIAYSTNAFEDREGEIFSTKSLEKYVAEAEKRNDRGYFNFWHILGTDFAKKEWQGVVGKFLVEAGPFLDNELGQKAKTFFEQFPEGHPDIAPEGWGCSPEYRYLPEERKSGIYDNIWITRTSGLPRMVAANIWTKGTTMALSAEQAKAATAIFGEELAEKIIKGAEGATKELEEAGVANKEVTTETTTEVVTETVQLDEQALVEKVAAQIGVDFQPIAAALTLIAETQTKFQTTLDEMAGRIKSLEKVEDVKTSTETPRFMVSVMNRASQAEKTIVPEGDALNDKKPVETQVPVTSGASAFFPAR